MLHELSRPTQVLKQAMTKTAARIALPQGPKMAPTRLVMVAAPLVVPGKAPPDSAPIWASME